MRSQVGKYRLVPKEGFEIIAAQSVVGEGDVRPGGQKLRARREAALGRVHCGGAVRRILPKDRGRVDNIAAGSPPCPERGRPAARQGKHVVFSLDDLDLAVLVLLGNLSRGGHEDDGEEEEALDKHGCD